MGDSEKVVLLNSQVARLKETLADQKRRIAELGSIIKSFESGRKSISSDLVLVKVVTEAAGSLILCSFKIRV